MISSWSPFWLHLQRPCFQIKSHSKILRGHTLELGWVIVFKPFQTISNLFIPLSCSKFLPFLQQPPVSSLVFSSPATHPLLIFQDFLKCISFQSFASLFKLFLTPSSPMPEEWSLSYDQSKPGSLWPVGAHTDVCLHSTPSPFLP